MAIQTIPGLTGFTYARVASMDKRAVGKLTDANHLESFHSTEPADYDKKIISLYTLITQAHKLCAIKGPYVTCVNTIDNFVCISIRRMEYLSYLTII